MNTNAYPKDYINHKPDHEESVSPYPHETNITDGGEFLDDGIRMKDQPLSETGSDKEDQTLADL